MQRTSSIREVIQSNQSQSYKKVTLTNLLQSQLASKQFTSIPIKQNVIRPHTMQIMRSRTSRIKSSSTNLRTQIKTRPFTHTQKKMNTYISATDFNIPQNDKLKVRKAYGRMNILVDGVQIELQKQLSYIFDFLEILSQTHNHHQKIFTYLHKRLSQFVYVNSQIQGLKKIAQISKNNYLIKLALNKMVGATYKDLCNQLIAQTNKSLNDKNQFQAFNNQIVQELHQKLAQKVDTISKLKEQLCYYMNHPSKDLYPKLKQLQIQNENLKKNNKIISQQKYQLQSQMNMYEYTNKVLGEKIQQLKNQVYHFQIEKLSSMEGVDKNSQLIDFEKNVQNLKEMLSKSVLRMDGFRQQYDKLKLYNQSLINQRSKLAKRAAVGFQQLTPRPKYEKIFAQNNLNFTKLTNSQGSTQQIVNLLVKTCKTLFGDKKIQLFMQDKQKTAIQNKGNKKDKGQSKKKVKNIASQVIDVIADADKQVNKTIKAAQEVKNAFNKQKKQREQLQANRNK